LAVLPLEKPSSGDPTQDYSPDGVTEELTTELAQVPALRVISRVSATHIAPTQGAPRLRVNFMSTRWWKARWCVRVTTSGLPAQLIEAKG